MTPGEVVGDRFELEAVAGHGGMGTVFRARDRATGERVALKLLRTTDAPAHVATEAAARFVREIRVLAGLRHPGIVRHVADGLTPDGAPWLAMEWVEGESLAERLARRAPSPDDSVALARRLAEALGAAHERGVIHRDVKPSNVLLPEGARAEVKVVDFGIARLTDATRLSTRTGIMVGTPGYMAPEQVRAERELTARADVFAIGCVLFECLTGRPAFVGEHVLAVLAKIVLEDPPRIADLRPDLPAALDAVVARAMARDPAARPRDGAQLAAELAALGPIAVATRPPTQDPTPALTATERRLLCIVLIGDAMPEDTLVRGRAPTAGPAELPAATRAALAEAARVHGAQLDRLADGSHVATLAGTTGARDLVAAAARCALAIRAILPEAAIAIATGRGVIAGSRPTSEAIDRAARLLALGVHRVRIDDVTAGLLDARFDLGGDDGGLFVEGERDAITGARTLLGAATPCVGRDRELATLLALYRECVDDAVARAVVLTAPEGVGKSRLRHELARRIAATDERAELWIGRGDPLRAGSPFAILASALRAAAQIQDGEPLEVRRRKLRARVLRHATAEAEAATWFLGELIGAPFPDDAAPELRAARQDAPVMGDQVRRAFEHLIAVETAAQPVVLVLDDLHWGDLPSVKLIDAALRALPDRPWLVVAFARPEVHELFPRLWAERGAQELRLTELAPRAAERLVRGVLGDRADDALVARLVDQAGGNAFYLEELIRAAAEGKHALPETVLALVQGRLERLEGDARRVLRAASVFGHRFWAGGIAALVGAARITQSRAWLDELVERELIAHDPSSRFPGEPEYRFRHALVRDAAYAMLTEADRRLGHRLAGEWLERVGEPDPIALAQHFERAGEPVRAANWLFHAAERALAACDFDDAAARARQAIACGARGELRGALALVIAEAERWRGDFAAAARASRDALDALPRGSARWCAAAAQAAEAFGRLDDMAELAALAEQLAVAPDDPAAAAPRVTATANAAFELFSHGAYDHAQRLLDQVDRAAASLDDPGVLARVHQARSSRAMFAGDAGAYLDSEQAAAAAFERAGDLRHACMQRGHVGYACLEIGAYAEAERWLRDTLAAATRLGLSNVAATAKHNLGRALLHRGALAEALAVETEALDDFVRQGDRRHADGARTYLAEILLATGDLARADRELVTALAGAAPPIRPQVLASLARVRLAAGQLLEAAAASREASAELDALGAIEEGESLVRLMAIEIRVAAADPDGARAAARTAYARLLARAQRITDPAWRRCFLDEIPDHRRTRELAVGLGVA